MKKAIILLFTILISIPLYSQENKKVSRFAILVGANDGGDERAILRYAETDAKMIAKVFSDIGGIETDNSILLLNPTKNSLIDSFNTIKRHIDNISDNTRTELIFYYSGHSDEDGLLIRDSHFYYKDLKQALTDTNADVKIGILDSCSSGAFTKLKGGKHSAPFLVDESIKTEGHAFITSAAEDEAAQESNRLQASFFTHFLVSALRGAADTSLDGKVSLHEAYSYASNETLARTETTQAGAQHASYDFRLSGAGDFVLTDLRDAESTINLTEEDFGRFFIRDSEDNLISEVNKKYGTNLNISVPSSTYTIIKEIDGNYSKQIIPISIGETKTVKINFYKAFTPETNVIRGNRANQVEYELDVAKTTAIFGWSTMDKVRNAKMQFNLFAKAGTLNGLQLSLVNLVINDANGSQLSPLVNINGGDLTGLQISGLFNLTGGNIENYGIQFSSLFNWVSHGSDNFLLQNSGLFNVVGQDTEGATIQISSLFNYIGGNSHAFTMQVGGLFNQSGYINGIQIGSLFNSSSNFNGTQISGLFNKSDRIKGLQLSGGLNFSDDVYGLQLSGLLNRSSNVYGVQLSLINVAEYVSGVQIGLINVNKDIKGIPIGLINISTDGIKNLNYRYNSNGEHYIDYQFGSSIIYHIVSVGLPNDVMKIDMLNLGAGLGLHIPLKPFYAEADIMINNKVSYSDAESFKYISSNPVLNIKIGLPLGEEFAIIAGTTLSFPTCIDDQNNGNYEMNNNTMSDLNFNNIDQTYFVGIRI